MIISMLARPRSDAFPPSRRPMTDMADPASTIRARLCWADPRGPSARWIRDGSAGLPFNQVGELVDDDEPVAHHAEQSLERLVPVRERIPAAAIACQGPAETSQRLGLGGISGGKEEATEGGGGRVQQVGLALASSSADDAQAPTSGITGSSAPINQAGTTWFVVAPVSLATERSAASRASVPACSNSAPSGLSAR